ncbi:glycosyltransferase family 9 protein [Candidatus Methylopumilus universalis]|uniref:glycosyltransferase family 9 protein n=1 Tax=Candidatus Methylopumilus universalis TaxID=2588536 RepID=UPI0011241090|nr:glycosyltransferase family 9 protein [Candidatus Methylopumilus universalis]QDC96536.1 glycosyltransferase family 9 protein [Candidatus Methylopumilus universalis]
MNRHFKKYYFYFLARLLDLFGLYDRSFSSYAKAIQYRTFLWDVQNRYIAAYQKSSKNAFLEIQGGIGDFLQHLPFILENKSAQYIVATHFKGAQLFFKALGIKVNKYYFYSNKEEYRSIRETLKKEEYSQSCPRVLFFQQSPFVSYKKIRNKKKRVIGIHPGASALGSSKAIPMSFTQELIKQLIQMGYKIILFGTKKELSDIKISKNKDIILASDKNIIKNLSFVQYCDLLIGSDSVFKTMASMIKIPTIVLHQNTKNNFRDRVFIKPYLKNHMMHVYKYNNFNKQEIKFALHYVLNILSLKFNSY